MESKNNAELDDLKEIAIGKIKAAYNRSIDLEATHTVLNGVFSGKRKRHLIMTTILALVLIITSVISLIEQIRFSFIILSIVISLILAVLIIWEMYLWVSGKIEDHNQIISDSLRLREQSVDFLENKLDNLDREGYVKELKILEVNDKILKERSSNYTEKLPTNLIIKITYKVDELEQKGFKKHIITQESVDLANKKLQKFNALRTCEAWLKFE